jgi:putative molybdopterin biosynthesis protein
MPTIQRLNRDEQLRAIADPNRAAILRRLMVEPATISQLGSVFGKHPAWIRHHVKTLESAGLVVLAETRTTRNYTEKYYAASAPAFIVEQTIRPDLAAGAPPLVFASHDFALELLTAPTEDGTPTALSAVAGSLDSLIAMRQGIADVAGAHLLDVPSGEYNVPYVRHLFPDRSVVVVTVAHRDQGLIVAPDNPLGLRAVADLSRPNVRFVNRNRGSGTRVWLDAALLAAGIPHDSIDGYAQEVMTHSEAADAISSGTADAALGVRAAADAAGLGFVELFTERYDLVIAEDAIDNPSLAPLLDRLHSGDFRKAARQLHGYDTAETGHERRVAI